MFSAIAMNKDSEFTWEQAKKAADQAVFNHCGKHLKDIELLVLQGSWDGLTYENMAEIHFMTVNYLRGNIGPELWQKLSESFGETVTKKNFKNALKRSAQKQLGFNSLSNKSNNAIADFTNFSLPNLNLTFPEGSVPLDSPLYLEREGIDALCYDVIKKSGSLLRIKAPMKMGKTSLITRILAQGKVDSYQTAHIDLSSVERSIINNLDKFLRWFCVMVGRQLELENCLNDYWDTEILGSNDNCTVYFEEYLLAEIDCPLVLGLDSVDHLFSHTEVVEDFLGMLRSWHEKGKTAHRWRQLRLVLAHSTESYIPLDINQSPFNAGIPLELLEFDATQIFELSKVYGLNLPTAEIEKLMTMVGGHPYLISLTFYIMATQKMNLEKLLQEAPTEVSIYQSHIRQNLQTLQQVPLLAESFKKVVLSSEPVALNSMQVYKLHSMGLIHQQDNQVIPRCNLYREYFSRVL